MMIHDCIRTFPVTEQSEHIWLSILLSRRLSFAKGKSKRRRSRSRSQVLHFDSDRRSLVSCLDQGQGYLSSRDGQSNGSRPGILGIVSVIHYELSVAGSNECPLLRMLTHTHPVRIYFRSVF